MSCHHEHQDGVCDHSDANRGVEFTLFSQIDFQGLSKGCLDLRLK